jgi:hypothetical protein
MSAARAPVNEADIARAMAVAVTIFMRFPTR